MTITGQLTATPYGSHPIDPHRARTIFCLPYAGGGASAYTGLLRALAGVTVVPLQLPGREDRIAEPPDFSIGEVTDQIAAELGTAGPYALYGHSMGARLAFEVARELRRRGLPRPGRLYVGGAHPPDRRVPLAATARLPDDAFIDQLVRRVGALSELKDEPELRELMLPILRADFAWINAYRYRREAPLDVPITAFTGVDDGEVGVADMLGWARHTTGAFALHTLRGGHFFVKDRPAELAGLIAADLAGQVVPPEAGEVHVWLVHGGVDPEAEVTRRYGGSPGHISAGHDGELGLVAVAGEREVGVAVTAARSPDLTKNGSLTESGDLATSGGLTDNGDLAASGGLVVPGADGGERVVAVLSDAEREQIEDAAEEDRRWLTLRAGTAKRALIAAAGPDGAGATFPDLADPGPWRAQDGPGAARPSRWQVVHLPLHTSRGEALGAIAAPFTGLRLRFDTLTGRDR